MDRFYHTFESADAELTGLRDTRGAVGVLRKALQDRNMHPTVIPQLTRPQIKHMLKAIDLILDQIAEAKLNQEKDTFRFRLVKFLLNLRGMAAAPLMPFLEEEHEYYLPQVTLQSLELEIFLNQLKLTLENELHQRQKQPWDKSHPENRAGL